MFFSVTCMISFLHLVILSIVWDMDPTFSKWYLVVTAIFYICLFLQKKQEGYIQDWVY